MTKTIFNEPWFTWHSMAGMRAALHQADSAEEHERTLLAHLLAMFLYAPEALSSVREAADFVALCKQQGHRSRAQIFQDLWVVLMTNEKRNGFFVEFGACDGVLLSNTLLLERDYGWSGILAEPNPVWHGKLQRERTCQISTHCVHAKSGMQVTFDAITEMPELSRISDIVPNDVHERRGNRAKSAKLEVETVSLVDLLDAHGAPQTIDYLSIDTEGSEFDILNAFDFGRYRFGLVTVEHAGDSQKREDIRSLLEANSYHRWFPELSKWDDWYVNAGR